jgi:hypothetical protein
MKSSDAGHPHLVLLVKDSGDGMVEGDGTTWIEVSRSTSDKLAHMMQDDDGKTELETFDINLEGMTDCLNALCSLQDAYDYSEFFVAAKEYINKNS